MKPIHLIIILTATLALGGATAWLILSPQDSPKGATREPGASRGSSAQIAADDPFEATVPARREAIQAAPIEIEPAFDEEEDQPDETAESQSADDESDEQSTRNSRQSGGGEAEPEQRPLTPREREEQRRIEHGRPALAQRMARTPRATRTAGGLAKPTERTEWEKAWHEQGINPPPMTPTPVTGKIMSQQSREGLTEARVHLMTFFPLDGVAGGPLLPVITELDTDRKGNFKGEVPASPLAPQNFPPAAVGVSWDGRRILAAQQVATLDVGQENALGIFWAPDFPYTLECDATQFNGKLSVVSSGEINPQRIHPQKQAEFLAGFPAGDVTDDETAAIAGYPPRGFARLVGTWSARSRPYISLRDGTRLVQTRRPVLHTTGGNAARQPEPFEILQFSNEGFKPIGGLVTDGEGNPLAGAIVSTRGGPVSHSAVSDGTGWFQIDDPHEATTSVKAWHESFVEVVKAVQLGDTNVRIEMPKPRPRIQLHVRDRVTYEPINDLTFKVVGIHPWGSNRGKPMAEALKPMTAQDGRYLLDWEFEIQSITVEKLGYFPRMLSQPVKLQEQAGGEIEVLLSPGRKLDIVPREFTAVQQADRWFADSNEGPGIRTYWSHHWVEWNVDFGDAPEEGEQGGFFDMVLGCTNHGIVDNQYKFRVEVYVDDERKGTLLIQADSITVREGRLALGALSGERRIRLRWTNDQWIPDQLDANIRYATLQFIEQPK